TDARRLDLDQHLAELRTLEIDGLDLELLAGLIANSSLGLHTPSPTPARSLEQGRRSRPWCRRHGAELQLIRPELRAMLDGQDFDVVGVDAVRDNVGRSDDDQFSRATHATGTAPPWGLPQPLDCNGNGADHTCRCCGVIGRNPCADFVEPLAGSPSPADNPL